MAITRVDHLEVWARDLDETLGFYVDVLGFEPLRRTIAHRADGSVFEQVCVTLGDFMIELIAAPADRADDVVDPLAMGVKTFALRVDDMAETVKRLKAEGIRFVQEPKPGSSFDGIRAEIVDPNGLGIELREWQRGDGFHNANWQPASPAVTRIA